MRVQAIFAALAVCVSLSAWAQDQPARPKHTYFLIDASGSMSRGANWGDVEDLVSRRSALILEEDKEAQFSFNRIAGDVRQCQTPVQIAAPRPFSPPVIAPPNQIGATLLGPALQSAIEAIGEKEAHVFVVTDGSEQCGPSICDVAQALLPTRPHITVDLLFTEDASPADKARLSCAHSAQGRSLTTHGGASASLASTGGEPDSGNGNRNNKDAPLTWLTALLGLAVICAAGCVVLLLLMASRRNEDIASGEEPSRQLGGWVMFWLLALSTTIGFVTLFLVFGGPFSAEWETLYKNLNGSLLSLLVSNAALGLIGWSLIQIWTINEFRQKNSSRKWKHNQEAKQFAQTEKPALERKRATKIREAKTGELRFLLRYFGALDKEALKQGWEIVESARDHVETVIALFVGAAGYEKRKVVRELSTMARYDYLPLIDILREHESLDAQTFARLSQLFADWEIVTARRAENQNEALQSVLNFDLKAITPA